MNINIDLTRFSKLTLWLNIVTVLALLIYAPFFSAKFAEAHIAWNVFSIAVGLWSLYDIIIYFKRKKHVKTEMAKHEAKKNDNI